MAGSAITTFKSVFPTKSVACGAGRILAYSAKVLAQFSGYMELLSPWIMVNGPRWFANRNPATQN